MLSHRTIAIRDKDKTKVWVQKLLRLLEKYLSDKWHDPRDFKCRYVMLCYVVFFFSFSSCMIYFLFVCFFLSYVFLYNLFFSLNIIFYILHKDLTKLTNYYAHVQVRVYICTCIYEYIYIHEWSLTDFNENPLLCFK